MSILSRFRHAVTGNVSLNTMAPLIPKREVRPLRHVTGPKGINYELLPDDFKPLPGDKTVVRVILPDNRVAYYRPLTNQKGGAT